MRSTWYFVFAVVSLAHGAVNTQSSFCQASGFLIQYGTETNGEFNVVKDIPRISNSCLDYAVLVIAINSALQVFRSGTQTTSEGLCPYQRYVYAGAFLIPILMSVLAFVTPRWGYLSQGAFCTLPIRPFWSRLALSWIPRYLIALTIIGIAIAIYVYVGFEFRAYSSMSQSARTSLFDTATMESQGARDTEVLEDPPAMTEQESGYGRRTSSITHDIVSSQRRTSTVSFSCAGHNANPTSSDSGTNTQSLPNISLNLSLRHGETIRPTLSAIPSASTVQTPPSNTDAGTAPSSGVDDDGNRSPFPQVLKPLENILARSSSPSPSTSPRQRRIDRENARTKRKTQQHIQRQLQLMFVYPIAYTLMWLLPFVQHCTQYQDKYANHPMWFLRMGGTICQTSMGFIDCLVFTLREKPWRNIPTSDGTFWGSFAIFRAPRARNSEARGRGVSDSDRGGGRSAMRRATTESSGVYRTTRTQGTGRMSASSNEYVIMAAEQARNRLGLEREERLTALRATIVKRQASMRSRAQTAEDGYGDDIGSDYDDGEVEGEKGGSLPQPVDYKGKEKVEEV